MSSPSQNGSAGDARDDLVRLTIDGAQIAVPPGTNVVDAAQGVGVEVPIFCHHPRLEPVGMCRMCLVEVGTPAMDRATGELQRDEDGAPIIRFFPKLMAGCTTVVSEGMVVRTATEQVADARRSVLEFLLTSHPLDCPVCDKGGECPLQNLTMRYGPGRSRFDWDNKYRFAKPVPVGPLIALDRERCVLCARCIRFQDEIADDSVLGFENRGRGMEIVSFSEPGFDSKFSGNTTDICPVGALTSKDFRFTSRVWELVSRPGVCGHCSVGCNLSYDMRNGRILRAMPRENDAVNEIWLCDKGRMAHHHAAAPERLTRPLLRKDGELVPVGWDEALGQVAQRLRIVLDEGGPETVGGIAGAGLCNEDLYGFGRFLRGVVGTNHVDHRGGLLRDDVLERVGAGSGTRLTELGPGCAVLVAGLDVEEEAPVLYLNLFKAVQRGAKVVTLTGRPQKLDSHADAHLRYRYGAGEADLLAALLRSVAARDGALPALGAETREALAPYDAGSLEGRHPAGEQELDAAADVLAEAEHLLVLYGREAVELGLVPGLAALAAGTGRAGEDGDGLMAVGAAANAQGAADMGLLPDRLPGYVPVSDAAGRAALKAAGWPSAPPAEPGMDAQAMLGGGVRALLVMGTDPAGDDPAQAAALEALDLLVVQELFLTETAARADVVLPAQSLPEREGTLTNLARRVQRTNAAADPVGEARPDWRILRDLSHRMGASAGFAEVADVFEEIAAAAPPYAGMRYADLGPSVATAPTDSFLPFAPMTEARHVSYEGTSYRDGLGGGLVWPLPAPARSGDPEADGDAGGADVADDEGEVAAGAAASDVAPASASGAETTSEPGATPPDPAEGAQDDSTDPATVSDTSPRERLAPLLAWRPAPPSPAPSADNDALTLVLTTELYDAGRLLSCSSILHPLVPEPRVEVSPFDAAARGWSAEQAVTLVLGEQRVKARLVLRDGVTPGCVQACEGLAWTVPLRAALGGRMTGPVRIETTETTEASPAPRSSQPAPSQGEGGV